MECNKWQESGLLYISHELDEREDGEFKEHMQVCSTCGKEVEQYFYDKNNFFPGSLLCESPSEAIDKKIIAACSQLPKMTVRLGIFSGVWVKNAVMATVFLLFGMSAGVYFTLNYVTASRASVAVSSEKKSSSTPSAIASSEKSIPAHAVDSSRLNKKDTLKRGVPGSIVNPQPVPQQGMVPVDLKKE
jgi:hypothetical protein